MKMEEIMYRVFVQEVGDDGGSFHDCRTQKEAEILLKKFAENQKYLGLMYNNWIEEVE